MTTATTTRVFGSGIRRREDPRLITGTARYTDDITLPGMVHAAILRSPHGHARITRLDSEAAKKAAGVVAVYTGADVEGVLNPIPCAWLVPNSELKIAVKGKVTFQADGDVEIKAGGSMKLEATGQMTVKGATVAIN